MKWLHILLSSAQNATGLWNRNNFGLLELEPDIWIELHSPALNTYHFKGKMLTVSIPLKTTPSPMWCTSLSAVNDD